MDIRVLKYFITVVKEQTISKAAESIHITQPTLSRQLMELETELGCKLFKRSNRKIVLTPEGLFLAQRAQEIISLFDHTVAQFSDTDNMIGGNIYIGCAETDAIHIIAKTANTIHQTNPYIRYHIISGNANDLTQRLDNGLLDFGIFIEAGNNQKYNFIRLPAVDTWGLLMPQNCLLAQKEQITASDLYDLPLICSSQELAASKISGWAKKDFNELNIVATYNLLYNASIMVEEGLGYALCLDKILNTTGDSKLCFRPLFPRLEDTIDIVWKKHRIFSKAAELFLKTLQKNL